MITHHTKNLKVLQVVTLFSLNAEYGGPARVAEEISLELMRLGHSVKIYSSSIDLGSTIGIKPEYYLLEDAKPFSKHFPISSLWSHKILVNLPSAIKDSDVVHIHFARDLIPMFAAFACILARKPFVLQTHGMLIEDKRFFVKFLDKILVRHLVKRAACFLALNMKEKKQLEEQDFKTEIAIIPNGLSVANQSNNTLLNKDQRIVFCSRLHQRKRVDRFLDLAKSSYKIADNIKFEIYGPDSGELNHILERIQTEEDLGKVRYLGTLSPDSVREMLSAVELLILPSDNEPFPMIVLEALSVGTPVLIMPSCELSETIKEFDFRMIAKEESLDGLISSFQQLRGANFLSDQRERIRLLFEEQFGISPVVEELLEIYFQSLRNRDA